MPFENSKIVWNWMVGIVGDRLILCRTFLATRASSVQLYVIAYNDLISKLMVVTDCVYKQCNSQSEAVPHSQLSVQSRGLREFISPTRLARPWSPDLLWVRVPHVTDHPCLWRNFHSTGWSQPVIATWKNFAAARGDRWTEWMNVQTVYLPACQKAPRK